MLLTEDRLRAFAEESEDFEFGTKKSASEILEESSSSFVPGSAYDIFLSHAFADAEIVLRVYRWLLSYGFSVYIDWIEDPEADRTKVTKKNADMLRKRMKACKSLLFVTSPSAFNSKWMPWECGFFDGMNRPVAVLPIVKREMESSHGQQFLGLYLIH